MPQDSRTRNHQKRRRAKKNALWTQKRAAEHAEADKPKTPAKKATECASAGAELAHGLDARRAFAHAAFEARAERGAPAHVGDALLAPPLREQTVGGRRGRAAAQVAELA